MVAEGSKCDGESDQVAFGLMFNGGAEGGCRCVTFAGLSGVAGLATLCGSVLLVVLLVALFAWCPACVRPSGDSVMARVWCWWW